MADCDITIDGSAGEGGGQIFRTSLALAAITGKSLNMVNIRAGRRKPGLLRQHLTALRAVAQICSAQISGDRTGSCAVLFRPGQIQSGHYHFRVGSAGSSMLVLQTVLPLLLTADGPSEIIVEGGTHNMQAPPFDFVQRSWLPFINRMGPTVEARLDRYGFFPAGGGRAAFQVTPAARLAGFDVMEAGQTKHRRLRAVVSNLSRDIGKREIRRAVRKLNWPSDSAEVEVVRSNGPGNVLLAEVECEFMTAIFSSFGRMGVRAESVADVVVRDVRAWLKENAPVGPFLADQLLLPLAISAAQPADGGGARGGRFLSGTLTQHSRTQMELLPRFLPVRVTADDNERGTEVRVSSGE